MRSAAEASRAASGRLITVATVTVAMLVTASPADGSFPGRNGDIAFDAKFDCGYERRAIGVMGPDGSARRQITECELGAHGPIWSPDGRSLFYWARSIWLMTADGSERREISPGIEPSFAPDGLHYAYVRLRTRGRPRRIWRARIDGGDTRFLRAGRSPLWSPDGRAIAYYPDGRTIAYRTGVWIMNARTGERLRRVAPRWMTALDWSPDGRRLLCSGYADDRPDLYIVRADGKRRPRRLTRTPARSESEAAWSPDGRQIVFGASTRPGNDVQQFILTMSAGGSDETVIWAGRFDGDDEDNYIQTPNVSWQPLPD